MMTEKELCNLRGKIVHKLTLLDNTLCCVIAKYYFGCTPDEFIFDILYEKNVPVFSKKRMLLNLFRRNNFETAYLGDIDKLLEIRNIFAHAWAIDCSSGPEMSADELKLRKNATEEYDEKALLSEFNKKFLKVQQYLFRLMDADPNAEGFQMLQRGGIVEKMHSIGKDGKTDLNDPCHCGSGKIYKKCHGK